MNSKPRFAANTSFCEYSLLLISASLHVVYSRYFIRSENH